MALPPGTRLGVYEVSAKIGEGGMGEVYRARDTTLDRDVALKVLPEAFTQDADRLARFEREAKVLASLNHPNIGGIYGLEESGDTRALVLEMVEGPTLADRIKVGPIPVDDALPIATQIAEALEAAHEQGVIHRDLKPANIKIRDDGTVKVLDFGLAKAFEPGAGDPNMSLSPTISLTAAATQIGMVIGTAAYMAPEQAKGKTIDKRADVWAFGAVLFEMLTGQRPFTGDDVSTTLARVIEREPDWDALPSSLSPVLGTYLRRCLAKEAKQRVHDVADVRLAMEGAFDLPAPPSTEVPEPGAAAQPLQFWQRPMVAVAVPVLLAAATGLAVWSLTRPAPPPPDPVVQFSVPLGPDQGFTRTGRHVVAVSPDGSQIVYVADNQLFLRRLDQLEATALPGTQEAPTTPFFSPDGQWVGFYADGQLKKVALSGGAAVTLGGAENPVGASWGADDMILFSQGSEGIWQVPGTSGTSKMVIAMENGEYAVGPQMLPGGEWVLYTLGGDGAGSWNDAQIVMHSIETGERVTLVEGGMDGRYLETGHLVYGLDNVVFAVAFDLDARQVVGGPVPLVQGVRDSAFAGPVQFDTARNGSLVYVPGAVSGGGPTPSVFVWVDRQGNEEPLPLSARPYTFPRVSPDGRRIATSVQRGSGMDLWAYDATNGTALRLTHDDETNHVPLWTPDGSRILFSSTLDAPRPPDHTSTWWGNVYAVPADGSGAAERLTTTEESQALSGITPDGSTMLYTRVARESWNIMAVPTDGTAEPDALVSGPFRRGTATISPNGRWLAYRSDESGVFEIYVQPYPGLGAKVPVSVGGGNAPVWSHDGRELFYRDGDDTMMAVTIEDSETLRTSQSTMLFSAAPYRSGGNSARQYHVAPDGRFLMMKRVDDAEPGPPQITVVLNWHEDLNARVPLN